jgi:hypothetical protein
MSLQRQSSSLAPSISLSVAPGSEASGSSRVGARTNPALNPRCAVALAAIYAYLSLHSRNLLDWYTTEINYKL